MRHLEEELEQIALGPAGGEGVADSTGAATRGADPTHLRRRRRIWERVCSILDEGIDAARENITATAVMDFPFCDSHGAACRPGRCSLRPEEHLHLAKEDGLLERAWVFTVAGEGVGQDVRLMVHGHSFLEWSARTGRGVRHRADCLTSVNWRIAEKDARDGWSQDSRGNACLPLARDVEWRAFHREKRHDPVQWRWREWKGEAGAAGFPSADLPPGRTEPDATARREYRRIQTLLQLADEAEVKETYSKRQTNKAIRSHGQAVSEMDITPLVVRRPRADLPPLRPRKRSSQARRSRRRRRCRLLSAFFWSVPTPRNTRSSRSGRRCRRCGRPWSIASAATPGAAKSNSGWIAWQMPQA